METRLPERGCRENSGEGVDQMRSWIQTEWVSHESGRDYRNPHNRGCNSFRDISLQTKVTFARGTRRGIPVDPMAAVQDGEPERMSGREIALGKTVLNYILFVVSKSSGVIISFH